MRAPEAGDEEHEAVARHRFGMPRSVEEGFRRLVDGLHGASTRRGRRP